MGRHYILGYQAKRPGLFSYFRNIGSFSSEISPGNSMYILRDPEYVKQNINLEHVLFHFQYYEISLFKL